jgi:hypothetical protein
MPAFIEEGRRLNEIRKALIYLSIWQSLGAIYLAPDNGVVVSPGFDNDQDRGNSGILGYVKDWVVRPTVSLFKLANSFNRDGKTRRIPLHKLYQVVGVEDSALTNILLGYQGKTWKLHTETYLLRRRRQSDDPESAVPSDSEIATFILVAASVAPYIPKEKPRAIKKHKTNPHRLILN